MPTSTLSPLLLPLLFAKVVEGIPINAIQFGSTLEGDLYPSAMSYDEGANLFHMIGNLDVSSTSSSACKYYSLEATTLDSSSELILGENGEICYNLESQGKTVYATGSSQKGGILNDQEGSKGFGLADSVYYGMLLDIALNASETGSVKVQGGAILHGARVVYPLALTADADFVYTVSLEAASLSGSDTFVDDATNATSYSTFDNPGTYFPAGKTFEMLVEAYPKKDYALPAANDTTVAEAFSSSAWERRLSPEGSDTVATVAGILLLQDTIIVGGSTNGIGSGLGVASGVGDMDGFITKLVRSGGDLFGEDEATAGQPSAYRIQSATDENEYLHGLCMAPNDEDFIYATGSSTGRVGKPSQTSESTRAFLMKIRVSDLQPVWTIDLHARPLFGASSAPVVGLACAVTSDGSSIYFAGNVHGGGYIHMSDRGRSAGGSDIFLAKVKADSGIEFVRQIGSPGNDELAPHGGLVVTADNDAVIFGQTDGDLYRSRGDEEEAGVPNMFVAVVAPDGSLPDQVEAPSLSPTPSPTPAPAVNATFAPTTSAPFHPTMVPTSAPTVPQTMSPTGTIHTFDVGPIKMPLTGVEYINTEAGDAFEQTMKQWYDLIYADGNRRRRLQAGQVSEFSTSLSYWGGSLREEGNLITYNQTVSFMYDNPDVEIKTAEELIIAPFFNEQSKNDLLLLLAASHPTFQDLGDDTGYPQLPSSEQGSGGSFDVMIIIYVGAVVFLVAVAWGMYYLRQMKDRESGEDPDFSESNDIDRPEAPLEKSQLD
jgi:hypothetical protein